MWNKLQYRSETQIIYSSTPTLQPLHGIPIILYNQLGAGSTYLHEKLGDASFWTVQPLFDELNNLLTHLKIQDDYDLLGHSWGRTLAACYAVQNPSGLKRLAIMSSASSTPLWVAGQNKLKSKLPKQIQDIIVEHEAMRKRVQRVIRSMKLLLRSSTTVICAG